MSEAGSKTFINGWKEMGMICSSSLTHLAILDKFNNANMYLDILEDTR